MTGAIKVTGVIKCLSDRAHKSERAHKVFVYLRVPIIIRGNKVEILNQIS